MKTYEEFKEESKDKRYRLGLHKCIVCGKRKAYWEIGDARYLCAACEEHAHIQERYKDYVLECIKKEKSNREYPINSTTEGLNYAVSELGSPDVSINNGITVTYMWLHPMSNTVLTAKI